MEAPTATGLTRIADIMNSFDSIYTTIPARSSSPVLVLRRFSNEPCVSRAEFGHIKFPFSYVAHVTLLAHLSSGSAQSLLHSPPPAIIKFLDCMLRCTRPSLIETKQLGVPRRGRGLLEGLKWMLSSPQVPTERSGLTGRRSSGSRTVDFTIFRLQCPCFVFLGLGVECRRGCCTVGAGFFAPLARCSKQAFGVS